MDEIFANPVTWFPAPFHWSNMPDLLARTDFPFLRQFFIGVPRELMGAARLDGASEFRIWWPIVLPQVRVALVIVGLFAVVHTWNEFFGALITALPMVILFLLTQRLFRQGLASSSLK